MEKNHLRKNTSKIGDMTRHRENSVVRFIGENRHFREVLDGNTRCSSQKTLE
jgi:hypothetical protein